MFQQISRCYSRFPTKKKKKIELMQTACSFRGFGLELQRLESPVKLLKAEAGLWRVPLPPSPTLLCQPLFQPLAGFQPLLQLLHSPFQDSNNRSRCSQDGDPCIYCIFFWLYGEFSFVCFVTLGGTFLL
ncbi:PREDICTED: uncharacterized protein LOC108513272 [Rhinopithecus bieti]|uniref:uncharacterized protein LOC108513272 n=1 Tax=Rhinopithecus bieti TaxID=61621 RepID=UPI00083C7512|nr:PREDICTED: uncharacterized protein LOC108513272 [Rhinopithecus bieti]